MRQRRWLVGTPALVLVLAGCATLEQQDWYNKAHDTTTKVVAVAADETTKAAQFAADRASKAYARMQHYLAEKDLLVTFHDASEHSESVVLDVLHKAGVGQKGAAPKRPPPASIPPPGAKPAPGATAGTPAPPPPAGALPEQYAGSLAWPIEAGIVSSEYGARWGKMHKGIDIAAEVGEPVYAIAPGEVIYAGDGLRGYGNVVILRHDRRRTSLYAHNSALKVKQGDQVAQGTVVALLGNTGHSTGPHVHFEIRDGDTPVNPRTVLPQSKLGALLGPADDVPADEAGAERLAAADR
jgi:murein DD-endopeptidase MepM/ murein hydrolase activator NlpD